MPALNEEGAIGGVVREIHKHVPGVPVAGDRRLFFATARLRWRAKPAPTCLPMPHHLGLGGCVQAGYKLAYELGFNT